MESFNYAGHEENSYSTPLPVTELNFVLDEDAEDDEEVDVEGF